MTDYNAQTPRPFPRTGEAPSQPEQVQDAPVVETAVEAKAGRRGFPVLMVLGVGLVLAVIAGLLVGVGT